MSFGLPGESGAATYPAPVRLPRHVARPEAFWTDPVASPSQVVTYDFRGVEELEDGAVKGLLRVSRRTLVRLLIDPGSQPFRTLATKFQAAYFFPADPEGEPTTSQEWLIGERAYQHRQEAVAVNPPLQKKGHLSFRLGPDTEVSLSMLTLVKWSLAIFVAGGGAFGFREFVKTDVKTWFNETAPTKYVARDEFYKAVTDLKETNSGIKGELGALRAVGEERQRSTERIEDLVRQIAERQGLPVPPASRRRSGP